MPDPLTDPGHALRAAVARMRDSAADARATTAAAAADLRRARAEIERTHRADPAYGTARRHRSGRPGPSQRPP